MLIQVRCKKCVFFHLRSHAMCRLITMFVLVVPEPRILFGTKTKRLLTRIVVVTLQCRFAEDGLETSLYVPFVLRRSYHPPSVFAFLVASARNGASLPILLSLHARLPSSCAVYVHAHGFFRPCNANATHLVAQTTTCPTTAPKRVHLENHGATASTPLEKAVHLPRPRSVTEVQLLPHRTRLGATATRRGKGGVTAPSTLGMPLPTPRTTRTRVFCASTMRGMATRSNRTTSSTTKRHALAQPPSRCVRRKNSVLGRAPRGHVFAAEEDDARATLRFAHERKQRRRRATGHGVSADAMVGNAA